MFIALLCGRKIVGRLKYYVMGNWYLIQKCECQYTQLIIRVLFTVSHLFDKIS